MSAPAAGCRPPLPELSPGSWGGVGPAILGYRGRRGAGRFPLPEVAVSPTTSRPLHFPSSSAGTHVRWEGARDALSSARAVASGRRGAQRCPVREKQPVNRGLWGGFTGLGVSEVGQVLWILRLMGEMPSLLPRGLMLPSPWRSGRGLLGRWGCSSPICGSLGGTWLPSWPSGPRSCCGFCGTRLAPGILVRGWSCLAHLPAPPAFSRPGWGLGRGCEVGALPLFAAVCRRRVVVGFPASWGTPRAQ